MKQKLMTIFARTPISVGAGSSVGAIDLPIMRERHTRIPIIPGSSVKGVLRDLWNSAPEEQFRIFGKEGRGDKGDSQSGKLLVGEARVLAFPVRSARGMFAWVTSPLVLERFVRDSGSAFEVQALKGMECKASQKLRFSDQDKLVLEEYCFDCTGAVPEGIVAELTKLSSDSVWGMLADHLAMISDEMFSYFVENACEIPARIRIGDDTGVVVKGGLFYQEQAPSETLFYNVLAVQDNDAGILDEVCGRLAEVGVLQFGGDETIGLGYCTVETR